MTNDLKGIKEALKFLIQRCKDEDVKAGIDMSIFNPLLTDNERKIAEGRNIKRIAITYEPLLKGLE